MESERFGPYLVHECLGAGGMAIVHRAEIELENDELREVALKRLLPQYANDKQFVDDFIREAKLAAQLDHPNIVRVLELGRIGRTYFIAMDLVRGRSLMSVMRKAYQRHTHPPLEVVLSLAIELLDALEHAHDAQIVHRDLTPSNLIVTDDGHLKIIDFGVAKALAGSLQTSSGLAKGKLGYMSMEAISGKHVDTRTDLFSAGVVLWELIATRRLFRGENEYELIAAIYDGTIGPPSEHNRQTPAALDDIVLGALAKSPDQRWQSAAEMRAALDEVARYYPVSADAVADWLRALRGETAPARAESEVESTEVRMSTRDMFQEIEGAAQGIAHGSQRGAVAAGFDAATFDDEADRYDTATTGEELFDDDEENMATIDNAQPAPRFKDGDTVVTSFLDRKR